jgi:hypothetical protein
MLFSSIPILIFALTGFVDASETVFRDRCHLSLIRSRALPSPFETTFLTDSPCSDR